MPRMDLVTFPIIAKQPSGGGWTLMAPNTPVDTEGLPCPAPPPGPGSGDGLPGTGPPGGGGGTSGGTCTWCSWPRAQYPQTDEITVSIAPMGEEPPPPETAPGYWQWESVFEVEAVISSAECGSNVKIPHGDLFPVTPDYMLGALQVTMECSFILQGNYAISWTMRSFWDWFRIDPGPDPPTFHIADNATSGYAWYHVE